MLRSLLFLMLVAAAGCHESRAPSVEKGPALADTTQMPATHPERLQGVHVRHDTTMIDSPIERSRR